jgi:hypothetical protein
MEALPYHSNRQYNMRPSVTARDPLQCPLLFDIDQAGLRKQNKTGKPVSPVFARVFPMIGTRGET